MILRAAPVVVLAMMLFGAVAAIFALGPDVRFTAAPEPPDFIYARGGQEVVVIEYGQSAVVWELSDVLRGDASLFIESIEPIAGRTTFVGVCCEPADGRQLLVDRVSGAIDIFPFTVRFPSTQDDASRYAAGGASVALNDLGSVLAYEAGVGVIAPGPRLLSRDDGEAFRPALLPQERIAVVDEERLVLLDGDGELLAESPVGDVGLFDYDDHNDVIVALVGSDALVVLDADSLQEIARWPFDATAASLDVRDGWILLAREDGALEAVALSAPTGSRQLIDGGVDVAAWTRG